MRIGVIQASSQSDKNAALYRCVRLAAEKNGREDTVILSHEQFMRQQQTIEELENRLAVYQHLAQSADDIRLGRVQTAQSAFDEILEELRAEEP